MCKTRKLVMSLLHWKQVLCEKLISLLRAELKILKNQKSCFVCFDIVILEKLPVAFWKAASDYGRPLCKLQVTEIPGSSAWVAQW